MAAGHWQGNALGCTYKYTRGESPNVVGPKEHSPFK